MSFCCAKALALTQGGRGHCRWWKWWLPSSPCRSTPPWAGSTCWCDLCCRLLDRWPDKEALELFTLLSNILPIYYWVFSQSVENCGFHKLICTINAALKSSLFFVTMQFFFYPCVSSHKIKVSFWLSYFPCSLCSHCAREPSRKEWLSCSLGEHFSVSLDVFIFHF